MEYIKMKEQIELETILDKVYSRIGPDVTAEKLKKFPVLKENFDIKLYEYILRIIKNKHRKKAEMLYMKNNGCSDSDTLNSVLSAAAEIYTLLYTPVKRGPQKGSEKLNVLFNVDANYFSYYLSLYVKHFFTDKLKGRLSYNELEQFIQIFLDADLYGDEKDKRYILDEFLDLLDLGDEAENFLSSFEYIKQNTENQSVCAGIKDFFTKKYNFINKPVVQSIFKKDQFGEEYEDPKLVDPVFFEDRIEANEYLQEVIDKIDKHLSAAETYALLSIGLGYSYEEIATIVDANMIISELSQYNGFKINDKLCKKLKDFTESAQYSNHTVAYYRNLVTKARKRLKSIT